MAPAAGETPVPLLPTVRIGLSPFRPDGFVEDRPVLTRRRLSISSDSVLSPLDSSSVRMQKLLHNFIYFFRRALIFKKKFITSNSYSNRVYS